MGELSNFLVESILLEAAPIDKQIVVYSGRFQPFHKGHFATYQNLVKKFGSDSVYIGTSNVTDSKKSPFNFNEKKAIMMKMFGIPSSKIVNVKNPYAPSEILNKYNEDTTGLIVVVGEKDENRLGGKYFTPYKGKVTEPYLDRGYVYAAPSESNPISGTDVRYWLSAGSETERKKNFTKAYPKFDDQIFKMITLKLKKLKECINEEITLNVKVGDTLLMGKFKNKKVLVKNIGKDEWGMPTINGKKAVTFRIPKKENLKEMGFPGGAGVGLSLPGGYINGAPDSKDVKKNSKKLNNKGMSGYEEIDEIAVQIDKIPGGLAKGKTLIDLAKRWDSKGYYEPNQFAAEYIKPKLIQGIKVEMEHTTDVRYATEIAMDHLWEDLKYYDKLASIENDSIAEASGNGAFYNDGNSTTGTQWNANWDDYDKEGYYLDNLEGWDFFDEIPSEREKKKAVDQKLPIDNHKDTTDKYNRILKYDLKSPSDFLKESLNEVKWEGDTFIRCMQGQLPLSLNIVKQLVDPIKTTSLHVTTIENLPKVAALEGTKKSISTFNKIDKYSKIVQNGKGVDTDGGVFVVLSGVVLAQSIMDLWTSPDKQGRRWVNPGTVIDGLGRETDVVFNFAPELKPFKKRWKEDPLNEFTPAEKNEFIRNYYDAAQKFMLSKKKEFQNKYLNSNQLYYESDWNEVVLNQIKIEKILVIPSNWNGDEAENQKKLKKLKQKYPKVEVGKNTTDIQNFIRNNGGSIRESVNEAQYNHNNINVKDHPTVVPKKYIAKLPKGNLDGYIVRNGNKFMVAIIDRKHKLQMSGGTTNTIRDAALFLKKKGFDLQPLKDAGIMKPKTESVTESLIMEGGAYGHMNHPFDIEMNLTFGDLKQIVVRALNGDLELAREKTDGQALAVSWVNGRLVAARNKSHLKNKGAGAMTIGQVADKFAGRGGLTDAYNFAMQDLSKAIAALSEPQRKKIFNDGSSFMNLEVIYPTSVNVIPYNQPLLVFHGTFDYDMDGTIVGENQQAASILGGMIKQVNAHVQSKYTIQGPPINKLPKSEHLSKLQGKYLGMITKLQNEFKLADSDGVADYHQAWWTDFVEKKAKKLDYQQKIGLVKRWAFGDKSFRIAEITDDKIRTWADTTDKQDQQKIGKQNLMRFEEIFLGVGADVLSFMDSVLTANPDSAKRQMVARLQSTISQVKASGDPKKIAKLKLELSRLNALGGFEKIVPNEGIVFVYGGNTYKLTGAFAPLNQILGIFFDK